MKYAAFIPAGPTANPEFVGDTIDSVLHYIGADTDVFVGDDSGTDKFAALSTKSNRVKVLPMPKLQPGPNQYNVSGIFFLKKARMFRRLVEEFDFDRLMNIDDDALVIGPGIIDLAERLFQSRSKAGILGRYTLTHDFQPAPYTTQLEKIYQQISRNPFRARKAIPFSVQPKLRAVMRKVYEEAEMNGYTVGTSFIGGSWFIQKECLKSIVERPEIDEDVVKYSPSYDDDLFTAFCYACGYRVYDLLSEPQRFHIEWRKLTMSPQELVTGGVSVIHSVRDERFGGESGIRDFFRQRRESDGNGRVSQS